MDRQLTDFLGQLNKTKTANEAWMLTITFMDAMGAKSLVYAAGETVEGAEFYTTTPDWWMKRYYEEKYAVNDTYLHHAINNLHPLLSDLRTIKNRPDVKDAEKKVSLEFSDTGVQSVLTIPLRLTTAPDSLGGFTIATDLNLSDFQKVTNENWQTIHIAILYAHSVIQKHLRDEQAANTPLSNREKECLLWLSRGMNSEQIADRLSIARITVDTHIGSAKRKLNAATREHALAIAIQLGVIVP